jgi:hypothetical protein
MKKILCLLLFVSAAAFLSSCKLNTITTFNADGSGEWRTESGFSAEERQNLESQANAPSTQDFCNSRVAPNGVTVTQEMRGDETWCISTSRFNSLDDLRATLEERDGLTINRLEINGDRFVYDIDIDTVSKSSDYSSLSDLNWTLKLPGDPISHNADAADGRTLIWTPELRSGVVNIHAESAVDKPAVNVPSLILGAGLALIGLLIIGGVVVLFTRRRRRDDSPVTIKIK